jgi:hypothetical protein
MVSAHHHESAMEVRMETNSVAKGLGMFSVGLGATQVLAPQWLGTRAGIGGHPLLMRALGARELASGIGVLRPTQRRFGLWARVAGDVVDLALLAGALRRAGSRRWSRWSPFARLARSARRARIIGSIAMVAGVTLADFLCARRAWSARSHV